VSNIISGEDSISKSGAGTLTLTGANISTGGTTVNVGTLGNTGNSTTVSGGILDLCGTTKT